MLQILICIILFSSCKNENNTLLSHRLTILNIFSIDGDISSKKYVSYLSAEKTLFAEFNYLSNEFKIVDLTNDSVVNIIPVPFKINYLGSISIFSQQDFAFITDTVFYVYKNGTFKKYDCTIFNDEYYPLNYINIIYDGVQNTIIAGVLSYAKDSEKKSYSSNFLNVYHLSDTTSKVIPFAYPSQYHDFRLRNPKVYLTQSNNKLVVSFGYDEQVYAIDLVTNAVANHPCVGAFLDYSKVTYPKGAKKQQKLDSMQYNITYRGEYGPAFLDADSNVIYRTYRPDLPENDEYGNSFTGNDVGSNIIKYDLAKKTTNEYSLLNGFYFDLNRWSYNKFDKTLDYIKSTKTLKNEKIYHFTVHSIKLYANSLLREKKQV